MGITMSLFDTSSSLRTDCELYDDESDYIIVLSNNEVDELRESDELCFEEDVITREEMKEDVSNNKFRPRKKKKKRKNKTMF